MREVTTSNFYLKYSEVEKVLKEAQFVSIDTEITGAIADNEFIRGTIGEVKRPSAENLYLKMKQEIKDFIIIQLGLTAFNFNPTTKKYIASSYVFYVYPRSVSSLQKTFLVQESKFEALANADFDLSKVFYKGITCLTALEEQQVFDELVQDVMTDACKERAMSMEEERELQHHLSIISKWQGGAKDGSNIELDDVDLSKKLFVYMLHKEIHRRFGSCWTFKSLSGNILVEKVSELARAKHVAQAEMTRVYEKELLQHYVGVSRIFKLLTLRKIPIVGSSPLLDFMMMYQQYHMPLPNTYTEFKTELNALFPHIYDAKYAAIQVQEMCAANNIPLDDTNGLSILNTYFVKGQGNKLPTFAPGIELTRLTSNAPNTITQEAGWDSYYTGCCFIRMAHFLAKQNRYGCDVDEQPPDMSVAKLFAAGIKQYKNCVLSPQANITHLYLGGSDPAPDEPQWLHVTAKSSVATKAAWVLEDMSRAARDSVQIQMVSKNAAVVVVNSRAVADRLVQQCKKYDDYDVQEYKKTSDVVPALIAGGAIGLTTVGGWLLYKCIR